MEYRMLPRGAERFVGTGLKIADAVRGSRITSSLDVFRTSKRMAVGVAFRREKSDTDVDRTSRTETTLGG